MKFHSLNTDHPWLCADPTVLATIIQYGMIEA